MKHTKQYNVRMELPSGGRFTVMRRAVNPQQAIRYALYGDHRGMDALDAIHPGIKAVRATKI